MRLSLLRLRPLLLAALLPVAPGPGRAAAAADFASQVLDATFKFFDPDSTATCFLVCRSAPDSRPYLVSAAHVLETVKGETAVLVLRKAHPDGSYERADTKVAIRRGGRELWARHKREDVAVLPLDEPLPVPVACLPESVLADEAGLRASGVHLCSPLFVLTFPQRFEANAAGFPVARQGVFASPPLLPARTHPTFLADFTTFAGDSGGPVFVPAAPDRPMIAGLVVAETFFDDRIKSEYEDRLVHYPLGIGTVLHAEYIRETLDAAARLHPPAPKRKAP